ncbi:MAG: DUF305 domain-containing protein [Hungatella hathewayi]|nr:DUF305 domain-containing protein [Hungatella hathewayi]
MNKQKQYWTIGIILGIILIVLIVFWVSGANRNKASQDPHGGHSMEETSAGQTTGTTPSSSAAGAQDSDALASYLKEQDQIMTDMMDAMTVEPTGNASVDFLKGMIPHHESAIDMSLSYLKYGGEHEELKQLAKDIIEAQTGEIDQMNQLIKEIGESGVKDEAKEEGYLAAYDEMMSSHAHMHHGTSTAKNVDEAFAEGMLMHHQMAVDMSKAILDYTDNEEVTKLAETIIAAQEKEIKQMDEILKQAKEK